MLSYKSFPTIFLGFILLSQVGAQTTPCPELPVAGAATPCPELPVAGAATPCPELPVAGGGAAATETGAATPCPELPVAGAATPCPQLPVAGATPSPVAGAYAPQKAMVEPEATKKPAFKPTESAYYNQEESTETVQSAGGKSPVSFLVTISSLAFALLCV